MANDGATAVTGENAKTTIDDALLLRGTQFSITYESSETAWGDSDSGGYTARKKARRDATGSLTGKLDSGTKFYGMFDEGDIIDLAIFEDSTTYHSFPRALAQNISITYDQDTKEVTEVSSDFGADGIFYKPGEAGAPSKSLPS